MYIFILVILTFHQNTFYDKKFLLPIFIVGPCIKQKIILYYKINIYESGKKPKFQLKKSGWTAFLKYN